MRWLPPWCLSRRAFAGTTWEIDGEYVHARSKIVSPLLIRYDCGEDVVSDSKWAGPGHDNVTQHQAQLAGMEDGCHAGCIAIGFGHTPRVGAEGACGGQATSSA